MIILDEGFPYRVYYTSLFIIAIMALGSASFQSFEVPSSLLAGSALSLGLCKLQWWTVRRFFLKGHHGRQKFFLRVTLLKYFLLCVFFYITFCYLQLHVIAFLVGISLVPAVVTFKMAGIVLVNYLNSPVEAKERGLRN
ncbi:MAG TPA: ATP synthase subunit I [Candidatus Hypogeohydataceae bacterium YC40]